MTRFNDSSCRMNAAYTAVAAVSVEARRSDTFLAIDLVFSEKLRTVYAKIVTAVWYRQHVYVNLRPFPPPGATFDHEYGGSKGILSDLMEELAVSNVVEVTG